MPRPTENRIPTTIDEFIAGAEEWGDTEIFSEEKLRSFCQRMMDAADDYDTDFSANVGKKKKIIVNVYHPNFAKADIMSDLLAGGFRACNGLLNEIFRLRKLLADHEAEGEQGGE
jgi:hypothetical protein